MGSLEILMNEPRHPRSVRPVLATSLLVLMVLMGMGQTSSGQQTAGVQVAREADPVDWRWALTQGGLTLVVLILGWSYKRDMERWSAERLLLQADVARERDAFQQARIDDALRTSRTLEALSSRAIESNDRMAAALSLHNTAVARNTDSTHRLAGAVEKLDSRIENIERRDRE